MSRVFTYLVCALALGAIVFLAIYEPLTKSTREDAAAMRDGRVLQFDPAEIREIRITSPTGEIFFKRRDAGWTMGPKPKDRADTAAVEKILKIASQLEFFDRIRASELRDDDQWGDYGLRNPKRRILFRGDRDYTLQIGKDAAADNRLFLNTGGGRDIFLVDDEILDVAFPENQEFRHRTLTDLRPGQLDRLVIRRPGGEIELVHDSRGWRMTRPLNAPASDQAVEEYLGRLLRLPIREFVADDTGDLSRYGIAEGRQEISFFADGRDRALTLRFGSIGDEVVLAQYTGRDTVYKLPKESLTLLEVSPDSFRDRRLLPLNLDLVDLIRFRSGDGSFELRRAGEEWNLVRDGQAVPASAAAIRTLSDAMNSTSVESYTAIGGDKLAAAGLKPPRLTIEFVSVLSENTSEATAGQRVIATVEVGQAQDGKLSIRVDDSPEIGVVTDQILHSLSPDPAFWIAPR